MLFPQAIEISVVASIRRPDIFSPPSRPTPRGINPHTLLDELVLGQRSLKSVSSERKQSDKKIKGILRNIDKSTKVQLKPIQVVIDNRPSTVQGRSKSETRSLAATGQISASQKSTHSYPGTSSSMAYNFQTIASLTADSEPSALIQFPSSKYLFNVPEGTQRLTNQLNIGLRNTKVIFVTSLTIDAIGGLPGMLFTVVERGVKDITLVGPRNLTYYVASMRGFFNRPDLKLTVIETSITAPSAHRSPIYQDGLISAYAIPVNVPSKAPSAPPMSPATSDGSDDDAPSPPPLDLSASASGNNTASTSPWSESFKQSLNPDWQHFVPNFAEEFVPSEPYNLSSSTRSKRKRSQSQSSTESKSKEVLSDAPRKHKERWSRLQHLSDPFSPVGLMYTYAVQKNIINRMFPSNTIPGPPAETPLAEGHARKASDPQQFYQKLPPVESHGARVSYVILGPSKRGKFDVNKADALGVPILKRAVLINEGQVEVDGRRVTSDQCLGPDIRSSATLIIDCPSEEYIDGLVDNLFWMRYQSPHPDDGIWPVHVIWHREGTWPENEKYQEWMKKFGPHVHHITGDPSIVGNHLNYYSAATSSAALSLLDPQIYKRQVSASRKKWPALPHNHHPMIPGQTISITPREPPGRISLPSAEAERLNALTPERLEDRVGKENPEFIKEVKQAKEEIWVESIGRDGNKEEENSNSGKGKAVKRGKPGDDVVVSPLGTGSSMPSKYRNVSSTHIHIPGYGGILLDTGEGTLGQLSRLFGDAFVPDEDINTDQTSPPSPAREKLSGNDRPEQKEIEDEDIDLPRIVKVMRELRMIFISHLHADHHLGLARLLRFRTQIYPKPPPLFIVCPDRIQFQLKELQYFEELGLQNVKFIDNRKIALWKESQREHASNSNMAQLEEALGLKKVNTVKVEHAGTNCYGIVITHRDGWKIAYSGDTKPCRDFAIAGHDATLLIHEATICDDEPGEVERIMKARKFAEENGLPSPNEKIWAEVAKSKGHSTFAQAINIGRQMRAQNILLTHFSQRYPKDIKLTMPPSREGASVIEETFHKSQNVGLALDMISIPIGSMWKLSHYNKAISALYADVEVGVEESIQAVEQGESKPSNKKDKKAKKAAARADKGNNAEGGEKKKKQEARQKSAKEIMKEAEVQEVARAASEAVSLVGRENSL
ncbi:Predicted metal-dependent hydrolase (beta-lactamase superfamily) [Phaffia rhodozyma]|uniref:ribonuclease Z n=1 Tax=Phaffia rhodozyma TaxID=264483 RepID=A0A0F7SU75_PHARH|nr:Predicted metal-dependent hydrolase (beta-lactamase superfamily) [Phaffia rhodozyma]